MGRLLRDELRYRWYLVSIVLVSYYLILLKLPENTSSGGDQSSKNKEIEHELEILGRVSWNVSWEPGVPRCKSVRT